MPNEDVYEAWVKTVNAGGGIGGHPIDLITEDDAANAGSAITKIQTLLSDHVDAIVDLSNVDTAWANTVAAAKIPVVGANTNEVPMFTNPDFYPEGQTADAQAAAYIDTVKAIGASTFGDIYCAETTDCGQFKDLIAKDSKPAGISLAYSSEISATAPNYTAQCVAAMQKHIPVLIVEDGSTIMARVAKDCDTQGYDPTYLVGGSVYGPIFLSTPGLKHDTWSYYPNLPYWVNSANVKAMTTAMDKYYPGVMQNATLWDDFASESWPSGILLEDAVKAGGLSPTDTPSAAEITNGLHALKGDTLDGWAPPLTFPADKPHPVDCWYLAQLKNGVPSLLDHGKLTCEGAAG